MRQARKRILSLLLALVMCLSLLPVTALAVDEDVTYTITFDANGGKFEDGSSTMQVQAEWLGAGYNITTVPPDPTRDGYTFDGWDIDFVWNHNFMSNSTVKAKWSKIPEILITFDPNGGTCDVKALPLDAGGTLKGPLPIPVRTGYTFEGWYGGYKSETDPGWKVEAGAGFTGPGTVTALWRKDGATVQTPTRIDFYPNGGTIKSIRGFASNQIIAGSPLAQENNIFVDENSGIGMMTTDIYGQLDMFPVIERSGYTFDGWYVVTGTAANQAYSGNLDDFSGLKKVELSTTFNEGAQLAAKWTKAEETFTVTFDLNGATGTAPAPQKVAKGKTIELPVLRASGAEFLGWGYSTDGKTLTEWKAEYPVTQDITLYAIWEVIPSTEDTYDFNNSARYIDNYKITDTYFDFLTQDDIYTKEDIRDLWYNFYDPVTKDDWGGSCFGMAAVYCMARGNAIDLSVFQSGTTTLRGLKTPRQSQNIQDLINFYLMAQSTKAGQAAQQKYLNITEEAARYKKIVSDLSAEDNFSVLCFTYGNGGGHAIVARSIERKSDGNYYIEIWDPNYPELLGELVISSNYSNAHFTADTSNASTYNTNTEIACIMPFSTRGQTYDKHNLQSVFGKAGNYASQSSSSGFCLLSSSVGDFTITAADGRSAVVKNGQQTSGDLPLLNAALYGALDSDYRFYINASDLDGATVTLNGQKAQIKFVSDNIYAKISADSLNSVSISDDQITTAAASAAQQEITMVSATLGNTWNKVTVSGKDTEFTLNAETGQLKVSSKNNVSVTVQGENVDSQKTSDKQTVNASPSGTAVAMSSLGAGTGTQQPSGTNPFTDVKADAYYYDAVLWAVEKKVTSGTSATTFSPDASCTRGQIVTFLWRAAGSPKPSSTNNPFVDVKEGAYYYDAILWAVEKGITSGTSATTFSPDASCTRGQTVTFLYRAAGSPKVTSSTNPFTDVKSGAYYFDAVLWAVEQKITSGTSATTFSPNATVTRGQTVTFLYRSQG